MIGFITVGRTHTGHVRACNEDVWVALPKRGVWAVADGMGGHQRGDHASSLVAARLAALPATSGAPDLLRAVNAALGACHGEIQEMTAPGEICGCTLVLLLVAEADFTCLWAGDSRLYRLRAGRLERMTRDHSLVQELADLGQLSPDAARIHPWRHQITRAVGVGERLKLDAVQDRILAGDVFLLCTDGLTSEIEDAEIERILVGAPPEDAADHLLSAVLARGARDNVTLVIVAAEEGVGCRVGGGEAACRDRLEKVGGPSARSAIVGSS
jgi:serine/threonine protein phosphatase PrpC